MINFQSVGWMILITSVLGTCDKSIRFEVPQPESKRNEKEIPRKLHARYRSEADSAVLSVTANQITRRQEKDFAELVSELDSAERASIKGDTVFTMTDGGMKANVVVRGDSVYAHVVDYDTIFSIANGNILRRMNGFYFLNTQVADGDWKVLKLTLSSGYLTLGTVSNKDDIENLRRLTQKVPGDTSRVFRPSRRQLKQFLEKNGFDNEERFVRLQ